MCWACRNKVIPAPERAAPRSVERLLVPWSYANPVRGLVLDLKLRGLPAAALPLCEAMASDVWGRGLAGSVLTWVPGRSTENRRRGYDHAEVLARGVARLLGLPVRPLLRRVGPALDQTGLGAEERRKNLERVFSSRSASEAVVLVDDVITTGATLTACARALRAAGAHSVEALVACSADSW